MGTSTTSEDPNQSEWKSLKILSYYSICHTFPELCYDIDCVHWKTIYDIPLKLAMHILLLLVHIVFIPIECHENIVGTKIIAD
jgi:hypothetical protein